MPKFISPFKPVAITVPIEEDGQRLDVVLRLIMPEIGIRGRRRLWEHYSIRVNGRMRPCGFRIATGDMIELRPLNAQQGASTAFDDDSTNESFGDDTSKKTTHSKTNVPAPNGAEHSAKSTLSSSDKMHHASRAQGVEHTCNTHSTFRINQLHSNAVHGVYIVASSDSLAAVYKPGGLHSASIAGSPSPSVEALLPALFAGQLDHAGSPCMPRLLNRLDGPTSGLVMVALDAAGQALWLHAEDEGETAKTYLAIACGEIAHPMTVRAALDTNNKSVTRVLPGDSPHKLRHTRMKPLAHMPGDALEALAALTGQQDLRSLGATLVRCDIHKGARHQIRAHMACIGHPLVGDSVYGNAADPSPLFLHHGRISVGRFHAACPPPWLDLLPTDAALVARKALELA